MHVLSQADVVISSGGVSRGSKDFIKELLSELGEIHFGEMCMKPGAMAGKNLPVCAECLSCTRPRQAQYLCDSGWTRSPEETFLRTTRHAEGSHLPR